ncbi:MAG: acyl-CoA dehydrogenase family protein [Dehalococcoidia bacterium]|jgi:alkylation response protein AidB-like acyl-CoA dehydrogenase|uniref:acyl-CoA dehydrogenase family protein n=1 Tax=Candidatus Amarobacter glycogenicus TaxID=3140699 RepID=UPI00313673F1|nr:acyl-CoA dehydrogenase family protein [Dehalococcoidia bacterium]
MEFRDSPKETEFRAVVREFLDREFPAEFGDRPTEWGLFNGAGRAQAGFVQFMRSWNTKLNERGWGAPAWPKEHGGGGLSVKEQFILSEEFAWRRAPRSGGIGHGWAGPTMMVYGTEEQKAEYLPKIISGEHIWCQLFSEPGAGSDLASLQTRAIRDGDDYVVNGQKIWTSGAQHAHMGILIARTNPDAPKHRGISYFLVDMKTPGIQVRPLINMLNSHEFNEVYFEDVRIPATSLLGEENRGWYLATTTLDFERSGIATSVAHQLIARDLVKYAKESEVGSHSVATSRAVRNELADRTIEAQVEALICYRIISMQERGEIPNKESSIAKLYSSELDVRLATTAMHLGGLFSQIMDRDDASAMGGKFARFYMHSTTSPIGGGTSEVQRNIISMRGLGLPRG